jgi:FolB domain-containing protein
LNINNYEAFFVLGADPEEKLAPRRVVINISIRFLADADADANANACNYDDIKDTVCYRSLLSFLDKKLEGAGFNLLEKATQYLYDALVEYLKLNWNQVFSCRVEVMKPSPLPHRPLESASFICSDW